MLLEINGLSSRYGRIRALRGVDLVIGPGETVALVGANGAGKTTLLKVISGLQQAGKGDIHFEGNPITNAPPYQRVALGIAQVPEGRQMFGPMSVEDNLLLGGYTQKRKEIRNELERMYDMFPKLKERRKQSAETLSGGEQQMLAIARALMARPCLLLLDEPSMGLAPLIVEQVFSVIKNLKTSGTTIFLVEQNAYAALSVADRGYVLESGQVTLYGSREELLENDAVKSAYLGL